MKNKGAKHNLWRVSIELLTIILRTGNQRDERELEASQETTSRPVSLNSLPLRQGGVA